jgi:hypothetical protein
MNILSKLFGKKKRGNISTITYIKELEDDYNQASSFIDNLETIEDCKLASTMIDDLHYTSPRGIRNKLCDKTFNIFLKQIN